MRPLVFSYPMRPLLGRISIRSAIWLCSSPQLAYQSCTSYPQDWLVLLPGMRILNSQRHLAIYSILELCQPPSEGSNLAKLNCLNPERGSYRCNSDAFCRAPPGLTKGQLNFSFHTTGRKPEHVNSTLGNQTIRKTKITHKLRKKGIVCRVKVTKTRQYQEAELHRAFAMIRKWLR